MNKGAFASHTLELERLSHLIWHYETVNQDQKAMLAYQQKQRDVLLERITEMDKFIKGLQKKIKSLEQSIKFEKKAADGIKKKSNEYEAEVFVAHEKSQHHEEKAKVFQKQVEEYLLQLQEERCHRLQLIHEKEMYIDKYERATKDISALEEDNRKIAQQNLNNLQKIETLLIQNQSASSLIQAQSKEIMDLNYEIEHLKKNVMNVNRSLLREENNHATYHHHMDLMQQEISFLRKQLIMHNIPYGASGGGTTANTGGFGTGGSVESIASLGFSKFATEKSWSSYQPHKSEYENKISNEVNKITAHRYNVSSFTANNVFSERNRASTKPTYEEIITTKQPKMLLESSAEYKSKSKNSSNNNGSTEGTLDKGDIESSHKDGESQDEGEDGYHLDMDFHMPSTISTADSMSLSTHPATNASKTITPLATPHRLYRSPFDHANSNNNSSQNLLSLGSSQDLLKQTNMSVDSSSSTVATTNYFDSSERVEMLDWIRTVSRKEAKKKPKRDLMKKNPNIVEDDMLLMSASFNTMSSLKNVQKLYGDSVPNGNKMAAGGSLDGGNSASSHKGSLEKKSLYVGSGLHLKHNEQLDHELKKLQSGSTKQILKKILGDREF